MKDTFNEYLDKAQKMNSSKVINENFNDFGKNPESIKAQIIDYLDQIFDVDDLIQIENFVEQKLSGDTSLTWGSSDGE